MTNLAPFNQAKLLGNLANNVNYGCCLAFCIEWVRMALYQYASASQTGAETRATALIRQAPTIAAYQSACNDFNALHGKPKPDEQNPNPKGKKPHQSRQCFILNIIGNQKETLKKIDASLRSTEDSFGAPRFKGPEPDKWPDFGKEIMTPDTFHILLLKRKDGVNKWHHAIASWAYQRDGKPAANLFDPNYGEVAIEPSELDGQVLKAVDRCESGASLHSLRYISVEKGSGPTAAVED